MAELVTIPPEQVVSSFERAGHPLTLPTPNILEVFASLGDSKQGACPNFEGLLVSQFFAPSREEVRATYGEIYQSILAMASVYKGKGLGHGNKIALAETNSLDFFSSYFGGLAVGATMVPINLLALQDESSKAACLAHMLSTPKLSASDPAGVDLFVLGKDPLFDKMRNLEKILSIKKKGWLYSLLAGSIERFSQNQPPQFLEGVIYKALGKSAKTPREKLDLGAFFGQLPSKMTLMLPEEKDRLIDLNTQKVNQTPSSQALLELDPHSIADILYTSGTSGHPKGVALTHENLAFTVASLTQGTEGVILHDEVLLMGLPFFHVFGKAVMLTALSKQLHYRNTMGEAAQIKMVLLPSLSKAITNLDGVIKTIETYGVTLMPSVPIFLEKLVEYLQRHPQKQAQVQTLRTVISGGAAVKKETVDALREMVPNCRVIEGYGSSEGGINLLNLQATMGFVGPPTPGMTIRLVGDSLSDDSKEEAKELWVKSPGVARAYVEGTTSGGDTAIADESGWFKTGDMVLWDEQHGVKIVGRQSFFIKIDNEKRSPQELEQAVMLADERILEVMAIAHQAGTPNEHAIALVVVKESATDLDEASIKKAMDQLAQKNQITRWKIPKHLVVFHLESVPVGLNNGFKREAGYKVVRKLIQEALKPNPQTHQPAIVFHSKSETHKREWTETLSKTSLEALIAPYC
jgi:acyl-CoA synthetase (AMP-forming)/AMP-acid ligase II